VERAEAAWRGAAVRLEQKADCAEVRDAAARIDELQEQVRAWLQLFALIVHWHCAQAALRGAHTLARGGERAAVTRAPARAPLQVGANSERVRALTSATYKRVDEHAGAIQRLAEVMSSLGVPLLCLLP
jgi:hypothetical protein